MMAVRPTENDVPLFEHAGAPKVMSKPKLRPERPCCVALSDRSHARRVVHRLGHTDVPFNVEHVADLAGESLAEARGLVTAALNAKEIRYDVTAKDSRVFDTSRYLGNLKS